MSVVVRVQFKRMPTPATIAAIIAAGVFDDAYEDSDILEDFEPVDIDLLNDTLTEMREGTISVSEANARLDISSPDDTERKLS